MKYKILGLDPGKSTGWAYLEFDNKKLQVLKLGVSKQPLLTDIRLYFELADYCVLETFNIRPEEARKGTFDWDPMITPQVIGVVKLLVEQNNLTLIEQSPAVKPVGYGFANQKYVKKKKGTHAYDALAHAFYFAVQKLKQLPAGLK